MTTEILIALQVLLVLLIVIVMLLLFLHRQKKTIARLKDILTGVKDDISGDTLIRHLQSEIDNTTAHCRQETVALKADLAAEDMAISLRFSALQIELALVQDRVGPNTPWREQIKRYEELATKIHELINLRVNHATRVLNDAHKDELADRDQAIAELRTLRDTQKKHLDNLKPLQAFIDSATRNVQSQQDMELLLHRALLGLCENFTGAEKLRELTYLLHESFYETGAGSAKPAPNPNPEPDIIERKTLAIDPSQNLEMLNNIISKQNNTIRTLRQQINALENAAVRDNLLDTVAIMEDSVQASGQCVQSLDDSIDYQPPELDYDVEDMHRTIEQFAEESATMVEKIHLLSNQNKQLTLEHEELLASMDTSRDRSESSAPKLRLKVEMQKNEIVELQRNFKDLETRYLALYAEQDRS